MGRTTSRRRTSPRTCRPSGRRTGASPRRSRVGLYFFLWFCLVRGLGVWFVDVCMCVRVRVFVLFGGRVSCLWGSYLSTPYWSHPLTDQCTRTQAPPSSSGSGAGKLEFNSLSSPTCQTPQNMHALTNRLSPTKTQNLWGKKQVVQDQGGPSVAAGACRLPRQGGLHRPVLCVLYVHIYVFCNAHAMYRWRTEAANLCVCAHIDLG